MNSSDLRDGTVEHDHRTERYFDDNTPVFSLERYAEIVAFLRSDTLESASLLDIGCGSGNVLRLLADNLPLDTVGGVDVSPTYLRQCAEAVPGCSTYLGSILDPTLRYKINRRFRYVLVGAVLHHLVGESREASLDNARRALSHAWSLVDVGGGLILMEPTFRPHLTMSALFYVKRLVSRFTSQRVALFGYWNNLGEPVVSYFSHDELVDEATSLPGASIALDLRKTAPVPLCWRLAGIFERADSLVVARKAGSP